MSLEGKQTMLLLVFISCKPSGQDTLMCLVCEDRQACVIHFYPTAIKGCAGIVFTQGVQMGGQMGGWPGDQRENIVWAVCQKP